MEIEIIDYQVTEDRVWIDYLDEINQQLEVDIRHIDAIEIISLKNEIRIGKMFSVSDSYGACKVEILAEVSTFEGIEEVSIIVHSIDLLKEIIDTRTCEIIINQLLKEKNQENVTRSSEIH